MMQKFPDRHLSFWGNIFIAVTWRSRSRPPRRPRRGRKERLQGVTDVAENEVTIRQGLNDTCRWTRVYGVLQDYYKKEHYLILLHFEVRLSLIHYSEEYYIEECIKIALHKH